MTDGFTAEEFEPDPSASSNTGNDSPAATNSHDTSGGASGSASGNNGTDKAFLDKINEKFSEHWRNPAGQTPIEIMIADEGAPDAMAAALLLCERGGVDPKTLGYVPPDGTGSATAEDAFIAKVNKAFSDTCALALKISPYADPEHWVNSKGETAIEMVIANGFATDALAAALLICERCNVDPATFGRAGSSPRPATSEPWPELDAAAYHGVAGEIVCLMAPQTEADPVALLLQMLIYTGNALNRGPYVLVGKDRHHTNLFGLLVGDTAKARKGLSAGHIRDCCKDVDPEWAEHRIRSGMSSGEGIIHHIRDEVKKYNAKAKEMVVSDPGIADKRLLLDEREFYVALTVMKREGNTLSGVIRDAWDCRPVLETLTKKEPTRASLPFVSITAHITGDELKNSLDHTSMANGYANRFLFACVRRSKMLPFGGDDVDLEEQIAQLRATIDTARTIERVTMTEDAKALWCEIYPKLSEGQPGMLGAITARAEAQTLRLSLIYALLDGSREIDRVHIEAGLALWNYCHASVKFIFGDMLGDTVADAILKALRTAGANGMTRTDINGLFGHNRDSGKILPALELLLTSGKARFEKMVPSSGRRGRPKETWYAI